uniref:Ubs_37 putative toxin n=1 Tax=Unedogemmula bisaya TaxID=746885 RepID=A0A098LXX4_UNEBI
MSTSPCFLLVALGLLLYAWQACLGDEHNCDSSSTPHPQGKCGSELSEHREELCEIEESLHGGTDDARKKRGRALPLKKRRRFLLKARAKRNEALPLDRARRGIVCECCKNHCNYEEFTEYCPPVSEGSS